MLARLQSSGLLKHVVQTCMRRALLLLLVDLEASRPAAVRGNSFPQVPGHQITPCTARSSTVSCQRTG